MILIQFKCTCMANEAAVHIKPRLLGEGTEQFIERVREAVGDSHHQLSPFCENVSAEYVKIPIGQDSHRLGGDLPGQ